MNKVINAIGMAIIIGKYMVFALLAGLTITTGVSAADPALMLVFEGND
ncbi:hypothetical protein MACH09_39570 [Vibrio sp. MACH09]|nr:MULTISPECIES: hypothetical protein [unclassified Vibrio]GLO63449.1 hypothetical protein MACH09_39570 [Vibrio sp. MACH09]